MPRYPVEEALLREPNLWVPGKKPVGNVKIDWGHSLSSGLKYCLLSPERNLINGVGTIQQAATVKDKGVKNGNQYFSNTDTGTGISGWEFGDSYSEFTGNHDRTFVIYAYVTDRIDAQVFVEYGVNTTGQRYTWRLSATSHRFEISGAGSTSTLSLPANSQVMIACCTGATFADSYLWQNGTVYNIAGANAINTGSTQNVNLGPSLVSSYKPPKDIQIHAFYGFGRKLSLSELEDLNSDPYQFLIPA